MREWDTLREKTSLQGSREIGRAAVLHRARLGGAGGPIQRSGVPGQVEELGRGEETLGDLGEGQLASGQPLGPERGPGAVGGAAEEAEVRLGDLPRQGFLGVEEPLRDLVPAEEPGGAGPECQAGGIRGAWRP